MLTINKFKLQILTLLIIGVIRLPLSGKEDDKLQTNKNKDTDRRFRYGIIPALAYDSDLGFRYGAVINVFDYGSNPENYSYDQHLFLRGTNTSTGSLQLQGLLESNSLIANSLLLYHTAGAGAYIVFNKDNVISINYGIPFSRRDGHGGLYVGSSLLF